MKKQLLPWQSACLDFWEKNSFTGIAHVLTGAGKTLMAIAAMEKLVRVHGSKLKIKIVVPKTFLLYQWHGAIMDEMELSREDLGFYSGSHKSQNKSAVMLYVINSARHSLARHVVEDIKAGFAVFLVADECHHYGSPANALIFEYIKYIHEESPVFTLGLSATPNCANYHEVLLPALGREIYRFGFLDALKSNVIGKFAIFNVRIAFCPDERLMYDELSDRIGIALHKLREICPEFTGGFSSTFSFFMALEEVIKTGEPDAAELAKTILLLSMQRKEIVYKAKFRTHAVVELLRRIPKASRVIIFGERIETAEEIYQRLKKTYHNEVGLYHSKIPKKQGTNTMRQFTEGEIRILVSCKTLDEGLNVADADVGIVVSSTGSRRQRVQRLGRVLRKKPRTSYFYYMYVGETTEEEELLSEMLRPEYDMLINRIDLSYNEDIGCFENNLYSELEQTALSELLENGSSPEEIVEFLRNADRGLLTEDWLMTVDDCKKKLETAISKDSRNYWISMLLFVKARTNRKKKFL